MRIFVAGATGVIGRPLVAALLGAGHEVAALARTAGKARALEAQGAEAAIADAFVRLLLRLGRLQHHRRRARGGQGLDPRGRAAGRRQAAAPPARLGGPAGGGQGGGTAEHRPRGNRNTKARAELGFAPHFPRWREGFEAVFAAAPDRAATAA